MFFSDLSKTAVYPNINNFLDLDRHQARAHGRKKCTVTKGGHQGEGKSLEKENQIIIGHCVINVCSVVDPDESATKFWLAGSGSALGMQTRIQEGKKDPQKITIKKKKVQVISCGRVLESKTSTVPRLNIVGQVGA
jgi:hypothetical protein